MRVLDFFQSFIDLFRSRYVRYLESEVVRLRQENAGLHPTLLASQGITVVASPDLQDLQARGRGLRRSGDDERTMKPVVKRGSHATWRTALERASQKEALDLEKEIASRKEAREVTDATQSKTG